MDYVSECVWRVKYVYSLIIIVSSKLIYLSFFHNRLGLSGRWMRYKTVGKKIVLQVYVPVSTIFRKSRVRVENIANLDVNDEEIR